MRTARINTDGYLRRHKADYTIVLITSLLLIFGAVLVYTISPALEQSSVLYRQLLHILLAAGTFFLASVIPIDWWRKLHGPLLVSAFVSSIMLLVPGFGLEANGATRWLNLGSLSFQPAELVKFAIVMYLAAWFAERIRTNRLNSGAETLSPLLALTGVVGVFVAVLQKDLGTMIALTVIVLSMLYVSGITGRLFARYGGMLLAAAAALIMLAPHRLARLTTFFNPDSDVDGAGYHINQALIAIGSGGWFGRGLGKSVQVFGYLPEAINDSIFAVVAEQFGFIGSTLVLFLYGALAVRILRVIDRAPTVYMRLIGAGMFGWLLAHVVINVGAMIGLVPLTGITLPFLSLGGTSLIFISAGFGIIFNISRYTSLAYTKEEHGASSHMARRRGDGRPRFAPVSRRSRTSLT
jgi:cell division protein FtsW